MLWQFFRGFITNNAALGGGVDPNAILTEDSIVMVTEDDVVIVTED